MKEDLIEKEIKRFAFVLQKLAGWILQNDFKAVEAAIKSNYNGQLIDQFLETNIDFAGQPFRYKELMFHLDLLYHRLIMEQKKQEVNAADKEKYLNAASRLLVNSKGSFDYALKIKIDEVQVI